MRNDELKPGDIAITISGKLALITGYKPANHKYPIIYTTNASHTRYKGNGSDFQAKIGTASLEQFNAVSLAPPPSSRKCEGIDIDCLVPDILKGVKIGDTIRIHGRRGPQDAIYQGYKSSRPKNPVCLSINGKPYKAPLSIVIAAKAKA